MNWLNLAKEKEESLIEDLTNLIKIPSLLDTTTAEKNAPFGKKMREALDFCLDLAKKDGFETFDVDGYAGVIAYGEGDETLGVLAHLDIVPVGDGWDFDPFGATIKDGYMIGRGTSDDKGPLMSAYYALKLLKEQNVKTNKKIYLILGCDEETGMSCMDYYKEHAPIPDFGFTPDAMFPVVYAEKGIANIVVSGEFNGLIGEMVVGERPNIVVDKASALIDKPVNQAAFDAYLEKHGLVGSLTGIADLSAYTIVGQSAHGSTPENGKNAAMHMFNFAAEAYKCVESAVIAGLFLDYTGKSLGINFEGKHLGNLTMNVGIVELIDNKVKITLDVRYPNDITSEWIVEQIRKNIEGSNLKVELIKDSKPLFNDPEGKLIKTLENAYRTYTNDYTTPLMTMGGGTYARKFDNFTAFGPSIVNEVKPDFVGEPHQQNEGVSVDLLVKAIAIYADAMYELTK